MLCSGDELRPYIEAGLGARLPEACQFIGKGHRGEVVAVAAFHGWRGEEIDGVWRGFDCEISLWSRRGLSRDFLRRCERYAFGEMGVSRVTSLVRADNPWQHAITKVGFQQEGRIRGGADGVVDLLVFGIRPGEFRYER